MAKSPPVHNTITMLGVDEARERILAAVAPLPAVDVPLGDALGLVLAADVAADADLPPFANSAMDGFAVRALDTAGAGEETPVRLTVVGQAPAGYAPAIAVEPGTAVRIMTGAPLPSGADAVVRFEATDEADHPGRHAGTRPNRLDAVAIRRAAQPGENIRPPGEDLRAGETVLRAGTRLHPAAIGLLAALGRERVRIHRRPRVAVLATGDEVCPLDQEPRPGQIRDSNGPMVAAFVAACGGEPAPLGIARDDRGDLRARLDAAGEAGVDLILTTGGVSIGDYDLVKDVLRETGRVDLWQVRLKPGKPLAFGRIGDRPLLGLPGNPVAAAVAFVEFARPAILRLLGRRDLDLPTVQARLRDSVDNRGGRRHYVRVHVEVGADGWEARLAGPPGAGLLGSLARANGLLVVPEGTAVARAGERYAVQLLDWLG